MQWRIVCHFLSQYNLLTQWNRVCHTFYLKMQNILANFPLQEFPMTFLLKTWWPLTFTSFSIQSSGAQFLVGNHKYMQDWQQFITLKFGSNGFSSPTPFLQPCLFPFPLLVSTQIPSYSMCSDSWGSVNSYVCPKMTPWHSITSPQWIDTYVYFRIHSKGM